MIVKIEELDHYARGITRIDGKIVFVENALKGEVVEIVITKEKKKYIEATAVRIIKKSPERVTPACPYYGICGGCDTMHMSYKSELDFKKNKIKNILKKYAGIEKEIDIVCSNKELNYRNKITLHNDKKIGYMKKNSNEIIEIKDCPLAMYSINSYISNLPKTKQKNIVVRTNELGNITSTIEDKKIVIKINEFKFMIDENSFFQVNNYICSELFKYLEKNIENCNVCLDLYSGVGTLSIVASKKAHKVYAIEVNKYSYLNALKNMGLNKVDNVTFMLGKVEDEIKKIHDKIDLIITDPPRSGMDKETIKIIKEFKPKKIIYISCDPMTLGRDLNILKEYYEISKIKLFDMFPKTRHIETFVIMEEK